MAFSLDQFYRLNRRIVIWIALFVLLWLLRDFFGVIFLTFVLAFIAAPLANYLQRWTNIGRRPAIVVVYLFFLAGLVSFFVYITPGVISETKTLLADLQSIEQKLLDLKTRAMRDSPAINNALTGYVRSALPDKQLADPRLLGFEQRIQEIELELYRYDTIDRDNAVAPPLPRLALVVTTETLPATKRKLTAEEENHRVALRVQLAGLKAERDELLLKLYMNLQAAHLAERVPGLFPRLWEGLFTLLLALLFSFLISMDIPRLERQVQSLSASRLRDFHAQTAQPVVRFAYVVGRAIQAQAMIAVVNTILTVIGLLVLDIPSMAMLSVIVFVCSFIPVLGVFISTTPIVLVGLNSGGINVALAVIAMVIVIHAVEAYLLNPLIYGKHLKLNPVLVLIILFVGHHAFGLWGMLLGVPVAHYFIHDVFGVPIWDESRLAPSERLRGNPSEAAARVEKSE